MSNEIGIIVVKALYSGNVLEHAEITGAGCSIDPACLKSPETDADQVAKTLAIGAGRVQCPGKNCCELQVYFGPDGRPRDYASAIGHNRFEHLIQYTRRDVDPEEICLKISTPK
jgi:hypothetical protein